MKKTVHFLGIGGSGQSAIAAIAQSQGYQISGCDKAPFNEFTKVFDREVLFEGHSADHLENIDILAVTPAIFSQDPNNPELLVAQEKGIPVMTWQEFMGKYLEEDKFVIAICGTHGKSTTTAMVGLLLEDAGLDPTVELGAVIPRWATNYRVGKSQYFITEADEFNDNFFASHPNITIVTTVEMDHPEYFKDFDAYKGSFKKFLGQTKGKIIANRADNGVRKILASQGDTLRAEISDYSQELIDFPLQVPGKHNILNASAAYQVGLALGIDPEVIKKSLMGFTGIGRRFEYLGDYHGAKVYSDFAHHPTEIKVTLEATREKFPDKEIVVVFQPHMFSRTKVLFDDFVKSLKQAPVDKIYILDIYPGREVDTGLVSSEDLVKAADKDSVVYEGPTKNFISQLKDQIKNGDIIFFVGAGDAHALAKELLNGQ